MAGLGQKIRSIKRVPPFIRGTQSSRPLVFDEFNGTCQPLTCVKAVKLTHLVLTGVVLFEIWSESREESREDQGFQNRSEI